MTIEEETAIRERLQSLGMSTTPDGRHFDRSGQPISPIDWAILFEDREYRRVAWSKLTNDRAVSTVWLGTDHSFGLGERQIFETMDVPTYEHQRRYATIEEALAGHDELVRQLGGVH